MKLEAYDTSPIIIEKCLYGDGKMNVPCTSPIAFNHFITHSMTHFTHITCIDISDSKWKIEIEIQCEMCISYSTPFLLTTWNRFLPIFNIPKLRVVDIVFAIERKIAFFYFFLSLIQEGFTCWLLTSYHTLVTLDISWMYTAHAWILCNAGRRSNRLVNAEMDCKQRNEMYKRTKIKRIEKLRQRITKSYENMFKKKKENGFFEVKEKLI